MTGAGYILSRKALKKFIEVLMHNETLCTPAGSYYYEDINIGGCMAHHAIFVDSRDELHRKRFFPVGAEENMKFGYDWNWWYHSTTYYRSPKGGVEANSPYPVMFHHLEPREMIAYEYFIYNVHPFGLDDQDEVLPRKLSLQEIIAASDVPSLSPHFKVHETRHELGSSEIF